MSIITICRGTKICSQEMAECLARALEYPIATREILREAASTFELAEEAFSASLEGIPRLWDRNVLARKAYVTAVQAALAERVIEGNLVYHGLAGQLLLRGVPHVLRLRVIAPLAFRIQKVMEHEGFGRSDAEQYIRNVDAERARWVRVVYGEDIANPGLYDMVLNLRTMSMDSACATVAHAVRLPDFTVTDEVRARLADFRLGCRVRLALATDPELRNLELEVTAGRCVVEISGSAPMRADGSVGQRIAERAGSVPGVVDVRLLVKWFDPYP